MTDKQIAFAAGIILIILLLSGCYSAAEEVFCQDVNDKISVCKKEKDWAREHKEHKKHNSSIEDCMNDAANEKEVGFDEAKLLKLCQYKEKFRK